MGKPRERGSRKWGCDVKAIRMLSSLFVVLGACSAASGGIRPSFLSDTCSWRATDIVVVTEGKEIDGVFTILEILKGDLKVGATIKVPELAEFKAKDARSISGWLGQKQRTGEPQFVTGAKMILFLRDRTKLASNTDDDGDEYLKNRAREKSARWQSANIMGDEVKYSTAWIEQGQVYC